MLEPTTAVSTLPYVAVAPGRRQHDAVTELAACVRDLLDDLRCSSALLEEPAALRALAQARAQLVGAIAALSVIRW